MMLLLLACSTDQPNPSDDSEGASDTGSRDEADADTDSDSDADSDTDTDSDSDTDTDTDTDADWDTGTTDAEDTAVVDTGDAGCDAETPVRLYISPDDSNSTSSPVQAREAVLEDWERLADIPIRTWEFFNYYSFDYPREADTLTVTPAMLQRSDSEFVLQIGVASEELLPEDRAPLNLVLTVDTSGSMGGDPFNRMIDTLDAIAGSLIEGDVVSMVEWSDTNAIHLEEHTVTGPDDVVLLAEIDELATGGGTNLSAGLDAAYDIASRTYDATRINRVVLITDGGANLGVTSAELIARHAGASDGDGIYLVGVGVGTAYTYNDELIDEVTDQGRGASVFVASEEEAEAMFTGASFLRIMDVAARNVSVELALPPGFEIVRFSGEEYSTDPREIEPQHLAPNDTMVFYQTLETCAPELATADALITVTVTWQDPITFEVDQRSTTSTLGDLLLADTDLLHKGGAVYAYAEGLKACTRASRSMWPDLLAPTRLLLDLAMSTTPDDADLEEIDQVVNALGG